MLLYDYKRLKGDNTMEKFPEAPSVNNEDGNEPVGGSEAVENVATIKNQKDLGSAALGATPIASPDLDKQGIAGKSVEKTTYIDSRGGVHSTRESWLEAEAGYREG